VHGRFPRALRADALASRSLEADQERDDVERHPFLFWIGAFDMELQGDWDAPYTAPLLTVLLWLH